MSLKIIVAWNDRRLVNIVIDTLAILKQGDPYTFLYSDVFHLGDPYDVTHTISSIRVRYKIIVVL